MQSLLQRLMGDATRLTQAGDLHRATAAIQAALAQAAAARPAPESPPSGASGHGREARGQAAPMDPCVIDVQAREVPSAGTGSGIERGMEAGIAARFHAHTQPAAEAGAGAHFKQSGDAGAAKGRVLRGSHAGPHGQRDYRLYVPSTGPARPLPLVVMLHGCTQDPDDFAAGTGMDAAAEREGFAVLYPAQSQGANPQRCWNWFKHNHQARGHGEPALLAGMVRQVIEAHGIDPRRVYVAGLSAGGAMAAILGAAYPDVFAAVGVHSGLAAGAANDLPSALAAMQGGDALLAGSTGLAGLPGMSGMRPAARAARATRAAAPPTPPTIVFHGDSDKTVHPVNGEHVVAACMGAAANEPHCAPHEERGRSARGRAYTRRLHKDAKGRAVAEHWVVHGAGHAWSGGTPRGSYTDATGPDATAEMLRFFFMHTLADAGEGSAGTAPSR